MNPNSGAFADQIIERFIPLRRAVLFCISRGREGRDIGINRYRPIEIVFTDERDRKNERESSWLLGQKCLSQGRGVKVASSPLKRPATLVPCASAGFSTPERAPVFVYTRLQADLSGAWRIRVWVKNGRFEAIPSRFSPFSRRFSKSLKTHYFNPFIRRIEMKFEEIGGNLVD